MQRVQVNVAVGNLMFAFPEFWNFNQVNNTALILFWHLLEIPKWGFFRFFFLPEAVQIRVKQFDRELSVFFVIHWSSPTYVS